MGQVQLRGRCAVYRSEEEAYYKNSVIVAFRLSSIDFCPSERWIWVSSAILYVRYKILRKATDDETESTSSSASIQLFCSLRPLLPPTIDPEGLPLQQTTVNAWIG